MAKGEAREVSAQRRSDGLWLLARHDFRQPIQSLELLAGAMASARTAKERRECAVRAAQLASSLRQMEEALTLIGRLESEAIAPALAATTLAIAIGNALDGLGSRSAHVECGDMKGTALADATLLPLALRGGLLYALRMRDRGVVRVAAQTRRGKVVVDMDFEGTHPASATARMAFVELGPAVEGGSPSVGLGPALVHRLAEAMGWHLALSDSGRGMARVSLSLPAAPRP